jgi:hypothetical protein
MPRRYTVLFVTIDTHLVREDGMLPGDEALARRIVRPLQTQPEDCLGDRFVHGRVLSSELSAFGVEIGDTRHHLHMHFIWTLMHTGQIKMKHIQRQLQDRLSALSTHTEGSLYLHAVLHERGRILNYQLKGQEKGAKVIAIRKKIAFTR